MFTENQATVLRREVPKAVHPNAAIAEGPVSVLLPGTAKETGERNPIRVIHVLTATEREEIKAMKKIVCFRKFLLTF